MSEGNLAYLFEAPDAPPIEPGNGGRARFLAALVEMWEKERPQRLLWVPVLWAAGSGFYFLLPVEPPLVLAAFLTAALALTAILVPRGRNLVIICLLLCASFCAAQTKSHSLKQDLVTAPLPVYTYVATVLDVEERATGGTRLHLTELATPGKETTLPKKVRILARTQLPEALSQGERISLKAVLTPLARPVLPGGYDFGRDLFLEGYGGSGFAVSEVTRLSNPSAGDKTSTVSRIRSAVDQAISDSLSGASAGLAKALLLGNRSEIPQDVKDAYRQAGLAHLLAISGLHMALVAGFVFLIVRQGLAFAPPLALRLPLKGIAAGATILALIGYLSLVGAPVSAQRATLMASCVMLAIIFGRSAFSLRTAALAACVILSLWPENVVDIGFQMSFAAVIALISGYEAMATTMSRFRERLGPFFGGAATYLFGVVLSTILAEIAIFPLSVFHFNEITLYGLIGNAVAVPMTGFWIMPAGIVALILTPLGLEAPAFNIMGVGLDFVTSIASDIAKAPGSFIAAASPPLESILLFFFGGLWLCLWRTKLRLAGLVFIGIAACLFAPPPPPTFIVSQSGASFAIRTEQDGYVMLQGRRSGFAAEVWARSVGQIGFLDNAKSYKQCDSTGCSVGLWQLEDGTLGAKPLSDLPTLNPLMRLEIIQHPAGFQDACTPTSLIFTRMAVNGQNTSLCASSPLLIGQEDIRTDGPLAIHLKLEKDSSRMAVSDVTPHFNPDLLQNNTVKSVTGQALNDRGGLGRDSTDTGGTDQRTIEQGTTGQGMVDAPTLIIDVKASRSRGRPWSTTELDKS